MHAAGLLRALAAAGGRLPDGEPDDSEWVRRIVLTASKLASGRSGEARLMARLMIGKVREEGGYASVTGALGRYWTEISNRLHGSYYVDSRGLTASPATRRNARRFTSRSRC